MTQYDSKIIIQYDSIRFDMIQFYRVFEAGSIWFDSICLETSQALMPRQTLPRLSVRLPRPQRDILGVTERPCPWMRCCFCAARGRVSRFCAFFWTSMALQDVAKLCSCPMKQCENMSK